MKLITVTCFFLFSINLLWAQSLNLDWVKTMGSGTGNNDVINACTTDSAGNVFAIGTFNGMIDFNPHARDEHIMSNRTYADDPFISKFSSTGQLIWTKQIECFGAGSGNDIAIDAKGNIVVIGNYSGKIDLDISDHSKMIQSTGTDIYIAKYTGQGAFIWGQTLRCTKLAEGAAIDVDGNDDILVAGSFQDSCDFDPARSSSNTLVAQGTYDPFVAKYSSSGSLKWAIKLSGSSNFQHFARDVKSGSNNEVIVVGEFRSSIEIDPGKKAVVLYSNGGADGFMVAYSDKGKLLGGESIGGSGSEGINAIARDNNNITIAGYFASTTDFDFSSKKYELSTNGQKDVFIAQYNSSLAFKWAHGLGGKLQDEANNLTMDTLGNTYVTGFFNGTTDFDPSTTGKNELIGSNHDIFIASYDSLGSHNWAIALTGSHENQGNGLAIGTNNTLALGGFFSGKCDADPTVDSLFMSNPILNYKTGFIGYYNIQNGRLKAALPNRDFSGGSDRGVDIARDSEGNFILTGYYYSMLDLDPDSALRRVKAIGEPHRAETYLAKYDSLGRYIWGFTLNGPLNDFPNGVAIDEFDNIYLTGTFADSVDLDPSADTLWAKSSTQQAMFVAKYDKKGKVIWGHAATSSHRVFGADIAIDKSNSVLLTGSFRGVAIFPGFKDTIGLRGNYSQEDLFFAKYDQNGYIKYARHLVGGSCCQNATSIEVAENNSFYLAGTYVDIDLDPSTVTARFSAQQKGNETFIAKYDSNGNYLWAVGQTGYGDGGAYDLALDKHNNVYLSGGFSDTVYFDSGSPLYHLSNGRNDCFVASYTKKGKFRWARTMGGTGWENAQCVEIIDKNVVLIGSLDGSFDFDPSSSKDTTLTSVTSRDAFLAQYDTSGNFKNVAQLRVQGQAHAIAKARRAFYLTGYFRFSGNFHPAPTGKVLVNTNGVDDDIYMAKYVICQPSSSSISLSACAPYTSPADRVYHTSGTYIDTIRNYSGCDSIITINLTILNTSGTVSPAVCESYTAPGSNRVYTKSGTYYDTLVNAKGCDSVLTINLTILTTYKEKKVTACDSHTSPSGKYTYTSSGTYTDTLVNFNGCDSIITLDVTINKPSRSLVASSQCKSYTIPTNQQVVTSSGLYRDTLINVVGCDSIITYDVTILPPSTSTLTVSACDTFVSPAGNNYVQSGTYTDTIAGTNGCDSVITINLSIDPKVDTSFMASACNSYTLPGSKQVVTQSGFYYDTLTRVSGCDSVMEINVTITRLNPDIVFDTIQKQLFTTLTGVTYQWIKCLSNNQFSVISGATSSFYKPTTSGSYAVAVVGSSCADTSSCETVVITGFLTPEELVWKIYPNPTSGQVNLIFDNEVDGLVEIMDISGKLLLSTHISSTNKLMDLSQFESGVYYVRLVSDGVERYKRIVKL